MPFAFLKAESASLLFFFGDAPGAASRLQGASERLKVPLERLRVPPKGVTNELLCPQSHSARSELAVAEPSQAAPELKRLFFSVKNGTKPTVLSLTLQERFLV